MSADGESHVLSKKVIDESGNITDYVDLKLLPSFQKLREKVQAEVDSSSWYDRYGADWLLHSAALAVWILSHFILASSQVPIFLLGIFLLGCSHACLTLKAGHCATHGSLSESKLINAIMHLLMSDFLGLFSSDVGYDIHIKSHHPHTNIIGLGDSSTWKAPFVPSMLYMFVAPLLVPVLIPLVAFRELVGDSIWKILRFTIIATVGLSFHLYLLTSISKLSLFAAIGVVLASRNVLTIPYIHVNIFQHIGLPMYSPKHRPTSRMYLMTTGVLNLPRNPILDYCFGHGLISCHIEHHLFPQLSDNMCLKVKPIVCKFCKEHDLPYQEDTYVSRTKHFITNYETLMVNAPPITSFVGLQ